MESEVHYQIFWRKFKCHLSGNLQKDFFPQKNFLEERVRWGAEGQILYPEEIEMAQLHTTPPLLGFLTMHHCTVL